MYIWAGFKAQIECIAARWIFLLAKETIFEVLPASIDKEESVRKREKDD